MEWISVSDRLPPRSFIESDDDSIEYEGHMVLLFFPASEGSPEENYEILVGIYEEEDLSPFPNIPHWRVYSNSWSNVESAPTHWMPLPDPPKD
jgi:uncharacterized protein DUF551